MKILHVIASMDPELGGVSHAVRTIVKSMSDLGSINEVVSADLPGQSQLWDDKFIIHSLGAKKNPWNYSPKLGTWLNTNVCNFDIVIVHGLWLHHGFAVKKAISSLKQINKPKLFVMPHGMLDPYFQKAKGRKLKAIRNYFYWKLIEAKLVNTADGLLFTCEQEKQLASRSFVPYTPKETFVVGLGIHVPPAYSIQMREAFVNICPQVTDQQYFLFLGRIHEKKGVDILLEAYNKVCAEMNAPSKPKLIIAGPGLETEYGKKIQALFYSHSHLYSNVFFSGMLTGDAKWGALYGCEAFILPSHQENFGIAVVEALACGKPVLISNQVNIWREIQNENSGIVNEDTILGMVNILKKWFSLNENDVQSMQLNAFLTYKKFFEIGTVANKIYNILLQQ